MSFPQYITNFENTEEIKSIKKKIHNQIYSKTFINTEYSNVYTLNSNINQNFIKHIIKDSEKIINDKNGKWLENTKHGSYLPIHALKIINNIYLSYLYGVATKHIEQKYKLPKWCINPYENVILNITNDKKKLLNNDFNYCLALKTCTITINDIKYELNEGDIIIFSGKYYFCSTETYLLLSGFKIFGGYEAKYEHNAHPNLIKKNDNKNKNISEIIEENSECKCMDNLIVDENKNAGENNNANGNKNNDENENNNNEVVEQLNIKNEDEIEIDD